jgi:hypothetical protein
VVNSTVENTVLVFVKAKRLAKCFDRARGASSNRAASTCATLCAEHAQSLGRLCCDTEQS